MIVEQINPLVVCGVIGDETTLVVTKCLTGPFTNRYDLPTAAITPHATLNETVNQITVMETGLRTTIERQLGTVQFIIPDSDPTTAQRQRHIISTFYLLEPVGGTLMTKRPAFTAALSAGAARMPLTQLNWANSSPMVMQAKRFLVAGAFPVTDQQIAKYDIPATPQFSVE
ncbi:phosphohydrolase [Lactobacillus sp. CBA3606]|uniref:phosphohydrolase n=1 Tax=Lactobacillus sp. CBA3606 TaxID=2099789 RepID=UPI000CFC2A7E|nr:phosphohydrolase [Lactobacillus sp. CBA3606]AVK63610.1 phosphohydrolase [Lactobacillus sp. CBA3606]